MPLIDCPDCQRPVSSTAAACPGCGRRIAAEQPAPAYAEAPRHAPPPYGNAPPRYAPPAAYAAPGFDPLAAERSNAQLAYAMYGGALVFGPLVFVALFLALGRRDSVRGSWLESHYNWIVDSILVGFASFLAMIAAFVLMIAIPPLGILLIFAAGFGTLGWHLYRLIRGYTLFSEGKPATGALSPPRW